MFGNYFGKRKIVELMTDHSVAKQLYSEKKRTVIKKYGHLIFKLFGYPLDVYSRQRARIIMRYLNPKKDDRVLDAGCGIGYYAFELATKFGCKVNGVDLDAEDIELANKIIKKTHIQNVEFSVCDISELKFGDETFDIIIFSEVLEHIGDDIRVLNELYRVLNPQGYLIISTPHVDIIEEYTEQKPKIHKKPLDLKGGHIRNGYSLESMLELLNGTGFNVVEYTYLIKKFTKKVNFPMFLLMYPISRLDYLVKGKGRGIVVKAGKVKARK
jgi:ubiquinone/menaquinone biosynthesis C-methylase UbiE